MEKNSREIFRELRDDISSYVELKLELLKLSTYERSGHLIAVLSYGLILLFLAFFAILFIFLALGFFMGDVFGSIGAGFAFVAVLYLLLIGLIMSNKQKICNTVLNIVIAALNGNSENGDTTTDTNQTADTPGEASL
jgi:ABC-type multidrug transport system permease subunit